MHSPLIFLLRTFISFIFILLHFAAYNQVGADIDVKTVNFDNLTDDQVSDMYVRANKSGMSQVQLEQLAQQRGMPASEVAKLRDRINELQTPAATANDDQVNRLREGSTSPNGFDAGGLPVVATDEVTIFGSAIFNHASVGYVPSQNIATPENYILGPEDKIIIDIYGASEATYERQISPDGKIFITGIGPVSLAGISVEVATNRLYNKLSGIYSGLKGNSPTVFLEVSLAAIRTIKVDVVGEAMYPGSYSLSSFSTAFNALYAAGGPSTKGSMRQVDVIRKGEKIASLDVYQYFYHGDLSNNPRLRDEDVLVVKPFLSRVELKGEARNTGLFEFKANESVQDLLYISGGFSSNAYKQAVTIDRISSDFLREILTVDAAHYPTHPLLDGDIVTVDRILDRYVNRVVLRGAVNRPGSYELKKASTLRQLVDLAQGFAPDVFLSRAVIIRQNEDFTLSSIAFSPKDVIDGNYDFELKNEDIVDVRSIFDLREALTVEISGEVQSPGVYVFSENMSVQDLIFSAGGFLERAANSHIEVARRTDKESTTEKTSILFSFTIGTDLSLQEDANEFTLAPFDLVSVKASSSFSSQKTITIEGEVLRPGIYALETEGDRLTDLITRAGGLTPFAFPEGASLIRSNTVGQEHTTATAIGARYRKNRLLDFVASDSLKGVDEIFEDSEGLGIDLVKALQMPRASYDLILQDGDVISIPKKLQTVGVRGAVLFPTKVQYEKMASFKDYISLAGGFSDRAQKRKSYIVYPNGKAQQTKNFLGLKKYPKIAPGADVFIPERPERRKLTPGEQISIATGLGSLALIINNLVN